VIESGTNISGLYHHSALSTASFSPLFSSSREEEDRAQAEKLEQKMKEVSASISVISV